MLVGTYLALQVNHGTAGIFSGQGRPLVATVLSFGLELPLSIGGVAVYVLRFHGGLVGVYWWGAVAAGVELAVVLCLVRRLVWARCADDARARQEASGDASAAAGDDDPEDGDASVAPLEMTLTR